MPKPQGIEGGSWGQRYDHDYATEVLARRRANLSPDEITLLQHVAGFWVANLEIGVETLMKARAVFKRELGV